MRLLETTISIHIVEIKRHSIFGIQYCIKIICQVSKKQIEYKLHNNVKRFPFEHGYDL